MSMFYAVTLYLICKRYRDIGQQRITLEIFSASKKKFSHSVVGEEMIKTDHMRDF